ncbi:hypothetical protein [Streptomyces sp. NPDC017086]|uniref:hypothetical protein n=1 Tax=Streptomyces sp. NPDC017086 TaxID=3364976 RepID=UPI0037AD30D0
MLEAELERVRAALADAEVVHRRRAIGLEHYLEALSEESASADVSRRTAPSGASPATATDVRELSPDYQTLMAATADAGADGLSARRTAVVLGWAGPARLPPASKPP